MNLEFTIIDNNTGTPVVTVLIPENSPIGANELEFNLVRDEKLHGIFLYLEGYQALQWIEEAAEILEASYLNYGVFSKIELIIKYSCSETLTEIFRGKFDFSLYQKFCSDICYITLGIEDNSCMQSIRNRWDVKVDLESLKSFDSQTDNLTPYPYLGNLMGTRAETLEYRNEWTLREGTALNPSLSFSHVDQNNAPLSIYNVYRIFQSFPYTENLTEISVSNPVDNYWGTSYTTVVNNVYILNTGNNIQYKDEAAINCSRIIKIECNFSGSVNVQSVGSGINGVVDLRLLHRRKILDTGFNELDYDFINNIVLFNIPNFTGANTYSDGFSVNSTYVLSIEPGDEIMIGYAVHGMQYLTGGGGGSVSNPAHFQIFFDPGSTIKFTVTSSCAETLYKGFMPNESFSRISEALTNDCLRVYSDYYGRINALPTSTGVDGCGSKRSLTNGLMLRQTKIADNQDPQMFVSMKQLFDGYNAIDNIGMGIEPDTNRLGYERLRIERKEFFYQDNQILSLGLPKETTITTNPEKYIQKIKFGYSRFETEKSFGLDDFHSQREYRSELNNVNNDVVLLSDFVASHYGISVTRRQIGKSLIDFRYDNDIFIIQVRNKIEADRTEANTYVAETLSLDTIVTDSFRQPEQRRNVKISPIRNILRHIKDLASVYYPLVKDYIFSSGTGNYKAKIQYNNTVECIDEVNGNISFDGIYENQNISLSLLQDAATYSPIIKNEEISFTLPLTQNEFETIQSNPYGWIEFQCGLRTGKGFIKSLRYRPYEALAEITLIGKCD